jgi:hypothetical protein
MALTKEINPKILARNERIRKEYKHYADVKHVRDKKIMEILEEKYLPLTQSTIWLIVTQTGFYKNY